MCPYADLEKRREYDKQRMRKYRGEHPEYREQERLKRRQRYRIPEVKQRELSYQEEYMKREGRRVHYNKLMQKWRKKNLEKYRTHARDSYHKLMMTEEGKQRHRRITLDSYYKLRNQVLSHYADGKPKCFCCGETEPEFLSADHFGEEGKLLKKTRYSTFR